MIVIQHRKGKIVKTIDTAGKDIPHAAKSLASLLFELSNQYPDSHIGWCDSRYATHFNTELPEHIANSRNIITSYRPGNSNFLPDAVGYIEQGVFINVNKKVTYPTWQMSSNAGVVHAKVMQALEGKIAKDPDFDYFLNSMAKLAMTFGLFCYSEPKLLKNATVPEEKPAGNATLFRFVKQHYKWVWAFLLLLEMMVYEKKFPIFAAIASMFYKRRKLAGVTFERASGSGIANTGMDVVIPTIGRKPYLHDFLKDLAVQTLLPKRIIIVEQNPVPGSETELDYIAGEKWPFEIRHIFIHRSGACNARNIALGELQNDWIFFADDDIRIGPDFLERAFVKMGMTNNQVFNFACLQKGQKLLYREMHQTSVFGGSCSIISRESLGKTRFNMSFEFGFGEDNDFGKQLMNKGFDVCYVPDPQILHLKAPVGGFRKKPELAWDGDAVKPKPSPTAMLYHQLHLTKEQVRGYKTILCLKFYKHQSIKNPVTYLRHFREQWNRSEFWAKHLSEKHNQ